MTESEIDQMVATLVRRFEMTKRRANFLHDEYLGHGAWIRHDAAERSAAQVRWQQLEAAGIAILQRIDRLAERQAA